MWQILTTWQNGNSVRTTENFNPKQPVIRAQAATILNRMLNGAGLATPKHAAPEAKS